MLFVLLELALVLGRVAVVVLQVRHDHVFLEVVEVEAVEELRQAELLFLDFDEEFLRVRASLRAGARLDVLLHLAPLLAVHLESLQKAEVLVLGPAAVLLVAGGGGVLVVKPLESVSHYTKTWSFTNVAFGQRRRVWRCEKRGRTLNERGVQRVLGLHIVALGGVCPGRLLGGGGARAVELLSRDPAELRIDLLGAFNRLLL